MEINNNFADFISKTPELLRKFLEIASAWYKMQGNVSVPSSTETGPHVWHAGDVPVLTTAPLDHSQIDFIVEKYAEAEVKEKAIAYIKGFIAGVMFVS